VLRAHCAAIAEEEAVLREGGGKAGHERQRKMGRLPVRERVRALLDKDSPFFEIGLWAAYKMYEEWGKSRQRELSLVSGMSRAFRAWWSPTTRP